MEKQRQLYLLMTTEDYQHELYRIEDPQSTVDDESCIASLAAPVFKMGKPTFPEFMNFAAIGSRIFMVGGSSYTDDGSYIRSNKVFIYDTVSSNWVSGPPMNSGKNSPYLITLGSKLFALSTLLNFWGTGNNVVEANPRFEMLDTEDLGRGWTALSVPPLDASKSSYGAFAYAAVSNDNSDGFIVASVGRSGTWVFDVTTLEWNRVSSDGLPFSDYAAPIPNASGLCCGYSLKSDRFCAFWFHQQSDKSGSHQFTIDEIAIDDTYTLSPLMPPLECSDSCPTVFGPDGRVYFVSSGVDKAESYDSVAGNRYVQVYALSLSEREVSKVGSKRPQLRKCRDKRRLKLDLDEGQSLEACQTKNKRSQTGDEGAKEEAGDDDDEMDLKLTGLWKRSFFGGPGLDPYLHVTAAFAM